MIKIKECGEQLVDIKKICPDVKINLGKERMKIEKTAYLRKSVAQMILKAQKELPKDITFIINDAWRPQYIQEEIIKKFIKHFSKKNPSWSKSKVIREVKKYVAPFDGKYVSGHMTGGAVDLRLLKKGKKIPMKSSKLTYQENALSLQNKLPLYIQKNRNLMFNALKKAGLSNYKKEYWHWSYGDVWWAKRNKKKIAIYGAVKEIKKNK